MKKLTLPALLLATLIACEFAGVEAASPRSVTPRGPLLTDEKQVVDLFQNAAPSVAYITTERLERNFFTIEVAQGAGSGFVWDTAGHVVTNYHVVEGARSVMVQLDAGQQLPAEVVGEAPEYDLAVVRLKTVPKNLRPIPVGTSADLRIGQSVYAIGKPFGLERTLTRGIVSALDRDLPTSNFAEIAGAIQTDAAINPGNSGGPLLDSAGRLIGVNSAIRSASGSSAGIGFAIPVDLVNRIVPSLISTGSAPRPGIGIVAVNPVLVARAGISGVVVEDVRRGSPADQAGLKPLNRRTREIGDIIVAINGVKVETMSAFTRELDRVGIGRTAEFTVKRDGKDRKVNLQVIDVRDAKTARVIPG
jgi:2-alkenal reductase